MMHGQKNIKSVSNYHHSLHSSPEVHISQKISCLCQ